MCITWDLLNLINWWKLFAVFDKPQNRPHHWCTCPNAARTDEWLLHVCLVVRDAQFKCLNNVIFFIKMHLFVEIESCFRIYLSTVSPIADAMNCELEVFVNKSNTRTCKRFRDMNKSIRCGTKIPYNLTDLTQLQMKDSRDNWRQVTLNAYDELNTENWVTDFIDEVLSFWSWTRCSLVQIKEEQKRKTDRKESPILWTNPESEIIQVAMRFRSQLEHEFKPKSIPNRPHGFN